MPFLCRAIKLLPLGLLTVAMIGCDSCDDRAKQAGEFGNLQFYYEPADYETKFSRPLATGSELTMYVLDMDKNKVQNINSVHSSNESAILAQTDKRAQNAIQLFGKREGKATIRVQAQTAKGQKEDQFPFEVIDTRQISLKHACTDSANAAYLVGLPSKLEFKRSNKGRVLVGESNACSVQVEPSEIEPSTRCDEASFKLPAFDSVGSIRLTPQFNNQNGKRNQLGVQIVSKEIIDFLPVDNILSVGSSTDIKLLAETMTAPHWPLCNNLTMEVVIETPNICSSTDSINDNFVVEPSRKNTFSLRGERPGECYFSVAFPEISRHDIWEFSVPVVKH